MDNMIKIKRNILKSFKIVGLTLVFLIMSMIMIPGYRITKNLSVAVYAQSLETEIYDMNTGVSLVETNTINVNVTETNILDAGNIVPNQYIVVLKENATFNPQIANDTVSSLSEQ